MTQFSFEAIGTHWTIDIFTTISNIREKELEASIKTRIELFEHTYSRFRSDSWLSRVSKKAGTHELPNDGKNLFDAYHSIYLVSQGAVTPLIGQSLVDAGYDARYSFTAKRELQEPMSWEDTIEVGSNSIAIKQPIELDLGALGKGHIIDIISEYLDKEHIESYCVDAGGDMRFKSSADQPFLRVGLEDPEDTKNVLGVFTLQNKSIAGSSGNRRRWKTAHKKFSHIINPKTGLSPEHISAIWVIAEDTLTADTLTTALYFMPAEDLLKNYKFSYLILNSDRTLEGNLLSDPMLELFI